MVTVGCDTENENDPRCHPLMPPLKDSLIIFGGSGGNSKLAGPSVPESHMAAWNLDELNKKGYTSVFYQQFQNGGKAATARIASSREELSKLERVSLICYSAGTEACLMYSQLRSQNGNSNTRSIVLLGGSYYTTPLDSTKGNQDYTYWRTVINEQLAKYTKILVLNDLEGESSRMDPKNPQDPSFPKNFLYAYHNISIHHYGKKQPDNSVLRDSDNSVDLNPTIRDAILMWIETGYWPLEEYWNPETCPN
jgi:hypothetical protein